MSSSPDPQDPQIAACAACGRRNRVPSVAAGVARCAACHEPLPWMVSADDDSFEAVTAGRLPVLVDVWAPWCGPCRLVEPGVEQATQHFAGRLKTVKVNVDSAPAVAKRFAVQGVPTLLLLRDGREVARHVGAVPAAALQRWVGDHLDALVP